MTSNALDYSTLFNKDLPAPAAKWEGHPRYNFIGGHSDPDSVPMEGFIEAAANVFSGDPKYMSMYSLDGPQGILPLRQFVVDKLKAHRGIDITVDEVLITSGSGQGIQIVNEVLLEEGDTVIVEEFSFSGALNFLRKRNVNFVAVKIDNDGIRMDHLEEVLQDLRGKGIQPKYIYTIPTLQNPNGSVMSMERRHRMLELSAEYGVPIFEDECYADLVFEDEYEPAIKALDDTNRVVHIGSFSKNLGPAMRLGYMVAPWEILSRFITAKADAGSGVMDQLIVGDFFANHYDEHIQDLRGGTAAQARRPRRRPPGVVRPQCRVRDTPRRHVPLAEVPGGNRRSQSGRPRHGRRHRVQPRPRLVSRPGRRIQLHPPLLRPALCRRHLGRRRKAGGGLPQGRRAALAAAIASDFTPPPAFLK